MLKSLWMLSLLSVSAISQQALAAELTGEWANEPNECDQMRVIYADDGQHLTKINVEGIWQLINENEWYREGDEVFIRSPAHVAEWTIERLDEEELHMVNQDPEAVELGAGEAQFYRCDPR